MTEQEFLEKRVPFWLENDTLRVTIPSNLDKNDVHSHLAKKFGYNWLFALRGYYWPGSHIMLYTGDYETPNVTTMVAQYLFNYFNDVKYLGLGCHKGKIGEIWDAKIWIARDKTQLNPEIFKTNDT